MIHKLGLLIEFILLNYKYFFSLSRFQTIKKEKYIYRSYRTTDFQKIHALYRNYNKGRNFHHSLHFLLRLMGTRYCIVIENDLDIIGFTIYYFTKRDVTEKTIHEGYICTTVQGQGLGSALRLHAMQHWKKLRIHGVSSRVSLSNKESLIGNLNLGFKVVDHYVDQQMNEERVYLKIEFDNMEMK